MSAPSLIVFLGPTLSVAEALRLAPCTVLPPARQGDVWRALERRPRAIALIDGVFESQPSVWHHELLAAMEAGVAVFGASSMGALRAAELERFGMVGVGQVFRWVRDGIVEDDSEVALLHTGPEFQHRAITLPLVNVRHAAALARKAGVLSPKEARALLEAARAIFYQDRDWPKVLAGVAHLWRAPTLQRWRQWAAAGVEDLKAKDARECLEVAAEFVRAAPPRPVFSRAAPSAAVRRRRLLDVSGEVMKRLASRSDAPELAAAGQRRLLLSGWARALGLSAGAARLERAEREWLRSCRIPWPDRQAFFEASGLDPAQAARLIEDLALEALMLEQAARLLPEGPFPEEALADQARVKGLWAAASRGGRGRGT